MRILVASDHHGNLRSVEDTVAKARKVQADLTVICGDITNFGSPSAAEKLIYPLTELQTPVLFVPGNCDPPSLADLNLRNVHSIHGRCEIYGGLAFIGIGGCPISPFHTLFEMSESEIKDILIQGVRNCPNDCPLIVVSHFPPKDTRLDLTYTNKHVGSSSLRGFIEERKPSLVLCGHIHEARGVDQIGETVLVNPGPAKHGCCAIININKGISIQLDSLQV